MIVGIDLGTTNSLVGVWRDGATVLIPNALGHALTPSAVGLGDDGAILVGLSARERLPTHPALTATAFKRYMGTDRLLFLGDRGFRPEELSALVLRSLKADAEAYLGEPVEEAIITVPAYFNDVQRKATKAAGALAGLKVNRLLTEPTAAALAYGLDAQVDDELLLVVDLGGGTFDVSLLHRFEGVMEVRATAGDTWLGGEDFVDAIVAAFRDRPGADISVPPAALRRQAELAKRALSVGDSTTISVVHDGKPIEWTLAREQFETISEPLLVRLRAPIERALRDARVDPDSLSRIILAGGASQMPAFRRLVARLFRRLPVYQISPEEVVARGAAVRAGMIARDASLEETVMTDVAPFTLGIETLVQHGKLASERSHGIFMPIIERNTVIPASRSSVVTTVDNNQRAMSLKVFQGEVAPGQGQRIARGAQPETSAGPGRARNGRRPLYLRLQWSAGGASNDAEHRPCRDAGDRRQPGRHAARRDRKAARRTSPNSSCIRARTARIGPWSRAPSACSRSCWETSAPPSAMRSPFSSRRSIAKFRTRSARHAAACPTCLIVWTTASSCRDRPANVGRTGN